MGFFEITCRFLRCFVIELSTKNSTKVHFRWRTRISTKFRLLLVFKQISLISILIKFMHTAIAFKCLLNSNDSNVNWSGIISYGKLFLHYLAVAYFPRWMKYVSRDMLNCENLNILVTHNDIDSVPTEHEYLIESLKSAQLNCSRITKAQHSPR